MARPRYPLTEMATKSPAKTRLLIFDTLEAAAYDYAMAGAMLGISGRQLRVICHSIGITGEVMMLRRQSGHDHRGRPRKAVPSKLVLQRVLDTVDGSLPMAARALGVSLPTLRSWLSAA